MEYSSICAIIDDKIGFGGMLHIAELHTKRVGLVHMIYTSTPVSKVFLEGMT